MRLAKLLTKALPSSYNSGLSNTAGKTGRVTVTDSGEDVTGPVSSITTSVPRDGSVHGNKAKFSDDIIRSRRVVRVHSVWRVREEAERWFPARVADVVWVADDEDEEEDDGDDEEDEEEVEGLEEVSEDEEVVSSLLVDMSSEEWKLELSEDEEP